jgi:hypothetical protein
MLGAVQVVPNVPVVQTVQTSPQSLYSLACLLEISSGMIGPGFLNKDYHNMPHPAVLMSVDAFKNI